MGKKKRNQKHGGQATQKKGGLNLPEPTGKLYWSDGLWSDPRWSPETTGEEAAQIRSDWTNLEWVKQTDWYKEKKSKGLLEKH